MKPTNPKAFDKVLAWLDAGAPEAKIEGGGVLLGFWMGDWSIELNPEHAWNKDSVSDVRNLGFDVNGSTCGTVCCIAGAMMAFELNGPKVDRIYDVGRGPSIQKLTGMCRDDMDRLFLPSGRAHTTKDPHWAAHVIRKYLETGIVDWKGCHDAQTSK